MGIYSDWKTAHPDAKPEKQMANVEFTLKKLDEILNDNAMLKKIYPVGSIYMCVNNTNPATWISGTTWEAWGKGRVPVGVNSDDSEFSVSEKTGGAKTHTLTVSEMPSHDHTIQKYAGQNLAGNGSSVSHGYWERIVGGTIASNSTGGNNSHSNLQPYITYYMFKRIS